MVSGRRGIERTLGAGLIHRHADQPFANPGVSLCYSGPATRWRWQRLDDSSVDGLTAPCSGPSPECGPIEGTAEQGHPLRRHPPDSALVSFPSVSSFATRDYRLVARETPGAGFPPSAQPRGFSLPFPPPPPPRSYPHPVRLSFVKLWITPHATPFPSPCIPSPSPQSIKSGVRISDAGHARPHARAS